MRRFVLLTLTVVCCVSAVRQSFQQQHQQHKAEFQEPSRQPSSENTAHGVWKPKRSAWLNDSPPTERMIGDFQGIEPIPKASIKGRYQSDELQNSLQSYDGTKRVVKHITSLEPSGYEGGNEGNNLEAWQSMQSSNHGGVFPDGYDGLSAIPRTVNNEVAPSSMRAPFRRPSRPQPPRIANLPAKTYSRIPPPSSRRHVPEMRQPSFVPPDRILSSSPLSGDFDLPMPPLDRFQRGSGDLGVATVTVEQTLTMTTQNETTIATTTMETNDTTTTAEVTRTSSLIVPSTTPNSPPDSSNENENAEIVSTTEKNEGSPHFSVKIPDAPPVFENILTASSEETDDDSLEDSHLSTVSKLPNGSSAKRSASYATQLAVDNVAEESRNAKLKCVPCTPGAAPVPPKEEHLPPLEPLPSVDGPYQIPKTLPVSPAESGSEEGSYASFGPPQPAVEENVKETTIPASIPETTAAPAPAPAQTTQPEPEPQPVEHMYEISTPAAALPLAPAPAPQPQPAEHTYGAQGPDIAPVVTATQAPVAPSNPEPLPPNPSQGVAVAPEPTHASIEEAEHAAETPSFPGQASYNNLEEDHDGGDVADLTVPDPVPSPAPESSSPVPGESNYANLEEDHEGEIHEIEETNPAPNVPSIPTPSTGESSYSTFEEETEDTHSGGSSYSSVDVSAEVDIRKGGNQQSSQTEKKSDNRKNGQGKDDEEYEMETENTGDESGEIISNIDEEQIPEVVVPTKPSGGSRSGTMVDNTAPQPNAYQSPQPIKVQVNPATVPYRPRPSPAPRIQPPRPYNPPQVQPQPVPFFQQQLSLPYQVQQPRYSVPMPYLPPNPAPFMPYQPIPQRPPPAGCCGGQLFSRQGGLCMPISFNPCQQQNSCGNSCGGGCGQPQQTSCCTQQVQPCCPQPAPQSCCCPPQPSICRHKRSLGYSLGMCQRRRF